MAEPVAAPAGGVVVLGPGLMGAQIGVEYALGGHDVAFLARRPGAARERVGRAWETAAATGFWSAETVAAARDRARIVARPDEIAAEPAVIVESIVEDLDAKAAALRPLAARFPAAIVATNTSSIPIGQIGAGAGAAARTVGVHYWNPPLLMPLVEVIRGEATAPAVVETMLATLRALGKRPVVCERDVPGFVWNRMQLALLREAVWLVEQGVAAPAAVDEIVRDGLARRWRLTGPFQTAALGGADTFERIANNLWPVLSNADRLQGLRRWLDERPEAAAASRERRDAGLRRELRRERGLPEDAPDAGEPAAEPAANRGAP